MPAICRHFAIKKTPESALKKVCDCCSLSEREKSVGWGSIFNCRIGRENPIETITNFGTFGCF
jgi:hypothetical protein